MNAVTQFNLAFGFHLRPPFRADHFSIMAEYAGLRGRQDIREALLKELAVLPGATCSRCGRPGVFIRERPFADGSGKVFLCNNPDCEICGLYFYPSHTQPEAA